MCQKFDIVKERKKFEKMSRDLIWNKQKHRLSNEKTSNM